MAYRKKRMYRKRKVTPRRRVIKKAIYRAKKTMFARRVKSVVGRMAETKEQNYAINNFSLTSVLAGDFDATIKNLTPSAASGGLIIGVSQGTGQGSRVGNKINVVKATLKGVIHINTTFDSTANYNMCPLYVAMYIIKLKPNLSDDQYTVSQMITNAFFENGNGQNGFQGRLFDLTRDYNTTVMTVLKKRVFKVGVNSVQSGFGVNAPNGTNQSYSDGTVGISKMFSIDVTKYLSKTMTFNDGSNSATQRGVWVFWVPLRVDGGLIQTSLGAYTGTRPCYIDMSYNFKYKDM